MDPEKILKQLTGRGVLVTPEMMERIKSGDLQGIGPAPPTEKEGGRAPKTGLSVKIRNVEKKERMSPQDFTLYYNRRYGALRDMLLKKMSAVSINKAGDTFSEVSLIGMVREKTQRGFILEDETGDIEVVIQGVVKEDDVVGVRGRIKEGRLFSSDIIWPDIPKENNITHIPGVSILLANRMDDNIRRTIKNFSLVLIPHPPEMDFREEEKKKTFTNLPNPCCVTINKDGKEFILLIYIPKKAISTEEAVSCLRRRHLSPERAEVFSTSDPYLIEPVPDLFWVLSNQRHVEQYGGVTIIMSNRDDAVKYDTETGESYFAYERAEQPTET